MTPNFGPITIRDGSRSGLCCGFGDGFGDGVFDRFWRWGETLRGTLLLTPPTLLCALSGFGDVRR